MDPIQNPLFKEPVGSLFRARREQMGLSPEDVAKRLKFSAHLVEAIESEQWEKLGAPIYAKSYITGYIRLLGLDEAIRDEIPNINAAPALKTITAARVEPAASSSKWLLAGLSILLLAALVAYLSLRQQPAESVSLDALVTAAAPAPADSATTVPVAAPAVAIPGQNRTSATPPPAVSMAVELQLRNSRESWVEIRGVDNSVLYSGLIPAGQEFRHALDKAGRITLGNASSAEVSISGERRDLTDVVNNDVARFSVGADGRPVGITP